MGFFKKVRQGKFDNEEKVRMFQRMGSVAAVIALALVLLIETGLAGDFVNLSNNVLTAMIVVLAVSLVGSMYFKKKG